MVVLCTCFRNQGVKSQKRTSIIFFLIRFFDLQYLIFITIRFFVGCMYVIKILHRVLLCAVDKRSDCGAGAYLIEERYDLYLLELKV